MIAAAFIWLRLGLDCLTGLQRPDRCDARGEVCSRLWVQSNERVAWICMSLCTHKCWCVSMYSSHAARTSIQGRTILYQLQCMPFCKILWRCEVIAKKTINKCLTVKKTMMQNRVGKGLSGLSVRCLTGQQSSDVHAEFKSNEQTSRLVWVTNFIGYYYY